ncbi:16S rRNA processing protein RimM [Marinobacterium lacunae]|uniref:Ribosome maturation factor RimM n=1 Tax=Marinobacterium lacunae TaxID=1232683 RepID=A0A081G2E2_9GAMM|nr:ribosome maturation factor RimM [Marinobacterium lacunae]KEA64947.1 16S rRNA processing protein RimM [Marinobacterium lacunae]MBR9882276.1 ribosome maturation factor RimM [Oceanospirillales bacterium]
MSEFREEDVVVLGRFTATYGVQGWIKVYSYTDPMENILTYSPWLVRKNGAWTPLKRVGAKKHGKGLIAQLDGIDAPEKARAFTNVEIAVPKTELPDLKPGEYYWSQLENLLVYTESGVLLGRVDHLMETGANDVLVVKGTDESIDREERLLPWLPDQVIKEIDLDSGTMRVDWDPEF